MSVDGPSQLKERLLVKSKTKAKDANAAGDSDAQQADAGGAITSSDEGDGSIRRSSSSSRKASSLVRRSSVYALALVLAVSMGTRFWRIWDPAQVVFDEVHFGKFASYYLRREYYFDVHPPLAKMVVALGGWLVGYDGHFLFDKIGLDYMANGVPFIAMRAWVAGFGVAIPPLVYLTMAESGYAVGAATATALLVALDNALVTQGRLILLDNIMIFFMLAAVYSYVRFFKLRYRAFGAQWWLWLLATGTMLGCAVSCKMVGLLTISLVGGAVVYDLWRIFDIRRGSTLSDIGRHFAARAGALIALPAMLYLAFFYIHFAVLTRTGPGDAYHSSRFQMQLIDNPMTKSSFDVHYGDQIAIKHRSTGVYLDSSSARYPLRYEDQRISSQGQQVTGAPALTNTSFWMLRPAADQVAFQSYMTRRIAGEEIPDEESQRWLVRHTDRVQLLHVNTTTLLRTHDVASPLTATHMEFTTVSLNQTAKEFADAVWEIRIEGAATNASVVQTSSSFLRLVSAQHAVAMHTHKKKLPDWGRAHQEINGNKKPDEKANAWVIPLIRGRSATDDERAAMKRKIPKLSFIDKFIELQALMVKHNNALTSVHPFQSAPITWPLLTRGISFWTDNKARKQIYLLGNPVGWWLSDACILFYVFAVVVLELCRRRNFAVVDSVRHRHLLRSGGFIASAWLAHYFPFFMMGRSLFLHHYLPAAIFAYMMVGVAFQFLLFPEYQRYSLRRWNASARALVPSPVALLAFVLIVALQAVSFVYFAPISYGSTSLTPEQVRARMVLASYDLHFQK
ncbi:Dolichyl-phosphate-mannose--protein mannosyltransferase 4 [Coemansia sp. RSA 1939]|nr:Dolichyl-phosphate-mannose--protein mannosyltransferase 4 [Coemansia sp. RSA 1939]KAJ2604932.1 Dolichyl-phosphate-mannose--protein mannosyltransferase 4 [Coemansia sp. RSA 1804]